MASKVYMQAFFRAAAGGAQAELRQLRRSGALLVLTVAQAVTFLVLVSLFGITGARAPTAIIDLDKGPYAHMFIAFLQAAHHSFDLRISDELSADREIQHGNLVATITIPPGFSSAIAHRQPTSIRLVVDNINTDMTEDIQRALPSAITAFGRAARLPGVRLRVDERDLIAHDTDFIPYLVVSALVSSCLIVSGILSTTAVAREFESANMQMLHLAPVPPLAPLLGRAAATSLVSLLAIAVACLIVICGYGVIPCHPFEFAFVLALCTITFAFGGLALGVIVRRTLPVASLVFGLALPAFLVSGSYEPERFDGNLIWSIAHFSPVYYAVGIIEHAAHDLHVTPESAGVNFLVLLLWMAGSLCAAALLLRFTRQPC